MRQTTKQRYRKIAVVAALAAVAGAVGANVPARATSSFSITRIAGTDRFQTADKVDQAAFPGGAAGGVALLADGIPGHQTDALAASGLEGINGVGVVVTDNNSASNSVPANTLAALKDNHVTTIVAVGGPAAITPAQVSELSSSPYNYKVTQPFAGSTRYTTMQAIDDSIPASSIGKDASGNPTAILASGDDHHFVDALSAGGLAYAKHFPVILTTSTSASLAPEAQQVITQLGIKDLIVVGGTASIPSTQYNPLPTGVVVANDYGGKDRSQTSLQLADFAISNGWLKNTSLDVARGDDGSDALAGAAFSGVNGIPTLVTNSPTDVGSVPAFVQEHQATLASAAYALGGTSAIPDSQISAISVAAGSCNTAPAGTIAPTSSQVVTSANSCTFVQGGSAYQYGPNDTYQLASASQVPGGSSSCNADSYADFQSRLSQGDQVTGTYTPGGTSTFCLNDQAPPAPASVSSAGNSSSGGVTVTWTAPSAAAADGVSGYQVWRAAATVQNPQQPSPTITCPSVYTVAPGSSPQTPPASPYTLLATVTQASGTSSYSYNDTTASNPNYYCYGVSSISPNAIGGTAPASAAPASPPQLSNGSTPGPTQASLGTQGAGPSITSISVAGQTITVNYSAPINPASVDNVGGTNKGGVSNTSDFAVTANASTGSFSWREWGSGSQVFLDVSSCPTSPTSSSSCTNPLATATGVTVTSQSGTDGNTVCAANSTAACDKTGDTASTSTMAAAGTAPTITSVVGSVSSQTVTVTYSAAIDCATVDTSSGSSQYAVSQGGSSAGPFGPAQPEGGATCTGPTSTKVVIQTAGLIVGSTVQVTYSPATGSTGPVVASGSSGAADNAQIMITGSVGQ